MTDDRSAVDRKLAGLVERLQGEALVHEDVITQLNERVAADELELTDLRAVRDALTPPELSRRPGIDLAASFLPATERVSGDFYLVAEGPHEATALVVGDVVGKVWRLRGGPRSSARCSPPRTVLGRPGAAAQLGEYRPERARPGGPRLRDCRMRDLLAKGPHPSLGYAGHPPVLWLDSGEELSGGRAPPLGLSEELAWTTAAHPLTPGIGVLLYTDGVTEARHDGEQFGQARLAETIQALDGRSPSEVVAAVTTEVHQFAADGLDDDLCVVAARLGSA